LNCVLLRAAAAHLAVTVFVLRAVYVANCTLVCAVCLRNARGLRERDWGARIVRLLAQCEKGAALNWPLLLARVRVVSMFLFSGLAERATRLGGANQPAAACAQGGSCRRTQQCSAVTAGPAAATAMPNASSTQEIKFSRSLPSD
jgi:hypothetical protein